MAKTTFCFPFPQRTCIHVRLGKEGVDDEPVPGVDGILLAQVRHDQGFVLHGASHELFLELLLVREVEVDTLHDVGQFEDLVDGVLGTRIDELEHELVVGDPEIAKPTQAGAGIHQEVEQHPPPRTQDIVFGELGGVGLVHGLEQLFRGVGERLGPTVIFVHGARGRGGGWRQDEVVGDFAAGPDDLAGVMVERKVAAGDVGQVGGDIPLGDGNAAVLHVLRVDEGDLVDQLPFLEQHGTRQAVEVTARDESIGRVVGHGRSLRIVSVARDGRG